MWICVCMWVNCGDHLVAGEYSRSRALRHTIPENPVRKQGRDCDPGVSSSR